MRKIKIKEIVCIIGLLGTLTAHSQNTVWQIGNKDKSAKEFKFYKNDYRNYINDVYLYEVGRNHSADFPYFLPGPSDAWAGAQFKQKQRKVKMREMNCKWLRMSNIS